MNLKVTVNGREIKNFSISNDGDIIIKEKDYENQDPINGLIQNAFFCNYKGGFKWKLELKKHIARTLNQKVHIAWYATRYEALNHIKKTNNLISQQ